MTTPQDLLLSLARAYSLAEIHFSGDPELNEGLEAVRKAQEAVGWVVVRVGPEGLAVRTQVLADEHGEIQSFWEVLRSAGIQELRLQDVLSPGPLEDFLCRLHPSYSPEVTVPSTRFRGLERVMGLSFRTIEGPIPGMAGSIQGLFQHGGLVPPEPSGPDKEVILEEAGTSSPEAADAPDLEEGEVLYEGPMGELVAPASNGDWIEELGGEEETLGPEEEPAEEPSPDEDVSEEPAEEYVAEEASEDPAEESVDEEASEDPAEEEEAGEQLLDGEADEPTADEPDPPDSGAEPLDAPEPPLPSQSTQGIELADEIRSFLESSGPERAECAGRIREGARRMVENRETVLVLDLMEILAGSAGADPGDPEVLELVSSLVTPGLAGLFLSRLGSAREGQERERLIELAPRMGREVAEALVEALGEARDRRQRRSFLDALGKLGPVGTEMAARMVEDSRWYVVRNGVSVLGEIAGEDAVLHLTATLGNDDPRVRKETVSALAKVGGDDASMLLLGMLDDPEAEVRAGTCRALGVLKVQKAVKPLLRILEADSNIDVQVETLQALGQIGDPGAVPLVAKKAAGGVILRRPQEVRIAAFRGLAGIGTPHAKDVLRKAVNDRDPRVRTAVKTLLLSG